MTDIGALARRIAREIVAEANRRYDYLSPRTSKAIFLNAAIKHAWIEAHAAGRSEGFAAGAQAMKNYATVEIRSRGEERDSGLRIAHLISHMPLPDEKEKP